MLALIVLHVSRPEPTQMERFATLGLAQGAVAEWILFPSIALVLVSGFPSTIATPAFRSRGWVWAKLATG